MRRCRPYLVRPARCRPCGSVAHHRDPFGDRRPPRRAGATRTPPRCRRPSGAPRSPAERLTSARVREAVGSSMKISGLPGPRARGRWRRAAGSDDGQVLDAWRRDRGRHPDPRAWRRLARARGCGRDQLTGRAGCSPWRFHRDVLGDGQVREQRQVLVDDLDAERPCSACAVSRQHRAGRSTLDRSRPAPAPGYRTRS